MKTILLTITMFVVGSTFAQSYYYSYNGGSVINGRYYSSSFSGTIYVSTPESRAENLRARADKKAEKEADKKAEEFRKIEKIRREMWQDSVDRAFIATWDTLYQKFDAKGLKHYTRKDFRKFKRDYYKK